MCHKSAPYVRLLFSSSCVRWSLFWLFWSRQLPLFKGRSPLNLIRVMLVTFRCCPIFCGSHYSYCSDLIGLDVYKSVRTLAQEFDRFSLHLGLTVVSLCFARSASCCSKFLRLFFMLSSVCLLWVFACTPLTSLMLAGLGNSYWEFDWLFHSFKLAGMHWVKR